MGIGETRVNLIVGDEPWCGGQNCSQNTQISKNHGTRVATACYSCPPQQVLISGYLAIALSVFLALRLYLSLSLIQSFLSWNFLYLSVCHSVSLFLLLLCFILLSPYLPLMWTTDHLLVSPHSLTTSTGQGIYPRMTSGTRHEERSWRVCITWWV